MSAHDPDRLLITAHRVRSLGWVVLGGSLGAAARYVITDGFTALAPWVTLMINVLGAFLLGALLEGLAGVGPDRGRRRAVRLLLGTGVLGGFTTYSALAVDTQLLNQQEGIWIAVAYAGGTVLIGTFATLAGIVVAGQRSRRRSDGAEGDD